MADKCAKCLYVEWNNKESYTSKDRYWCKEKCRYIEPTDNACYAFLEDKSKKNDGGYQPSGCYITTIIVEILGYEDNCEVLNVLRNFRDTTLKTNVDYLPLLFEYDKVGPIICEYLRKEKNNYRFCLGLLQYFLIPCVKAIKEEKNEEAINIYQNMVMYLNDEFNLPSIEIKAPESYDLETLGKGRIRKIATSEI